MAVTAGLRSFQNKIVAAICLVFVLAASPMLWNQGIAQASTEETRILIAWEGGGASIEGLLIQTERDQGLRNRIKSVHGLKEEFEEGSWPAPQVQSISLPPGTTYDTVEEVVSGLPGVRYVEKDTRVGVCEISRDPYFSEQWHLPRTGVVRAWEASAGSQELLVAVVDSGVDATHPDFTGRVRQGYDFVDLDSNPSDPYGHGTHVAGIIAASGDNGQGVAGLAWRVGILPVRVLDGNGQGYFSDVIAGIRYAADQGADVINLSLGGSTAPQALQEAVDYAYSQGVIIVAAAGNNGLETLSYPAACQHVIGVGASDQDDRPTTFSNRSAGLDLLAPGVSIYSDYPGNRYMAMSGTSMSAPQVSGALALLLSAQPDLSPEEAERVLTQAATDLGVEGRDDSTGWGLLRVDKALGLDRPSDTSSDGNWYFAEGYTGPGFDTYVLLENPDSQASEAEIELFGPGGPLYNTTIDVSPRSRLTIHLNELIPPGEAAVKLALPEGSLIQAQRSMYFDYQGLSDGHTTRASRASKQWYFAEGYTGAGFDTYILVFNPQTTTAQVDMQLMTPNGTVDHTVQVAPLARRTIKLNDIVPGAEVAASLTSDRPVVAERAMYFDIQERQGGSVVMGAEATSEDWYFAEGYTGGEFDEWLLLANPSDSTVTAIASFQRSDGVIVECENVLQPRSRATIHVDEVPGLENTEMSATVKAAFPGVVAERTMYFSYSGSMGTVGGGHAAMGNTEPSSHWLLPEGYTGKGFESWILISNLEDEPVTLRVEFLGESGTTVIRDYTISAHSRYTIKENDILPGEGVSAEVIAPEGTLLVVEGAFYFSYQGSICGGSA